MPENQSAQEAHSAAPNRALAILLILYAYSVIDRQVISLLVGPIKADLALSDFQFSLVQGAAFAVFYCTMGLPIGWAVDRFPRRRIIFVGVIIWSIATVATSTVRSFAQIFMARAAVGVGEASLAPAAHSIIGDLFPPERLSFAMSVFALGAGMGVGISFFLGGGLVGVAESWGPVAIPLIGIVQPWRLVMLIVGVPGLVIACLIYLIAEPRRRHIGRPVPKAGDGSAGMEPAGIRMFIRNNRRFLFCHNFGFGLLQAALIGTQLWMPTYLLRRFGVGVAESGLYLGLIFIGTVLVGLPFHGKCVDYLYRRGDRGAHLRWYGLLSLASAIVAVVTYCAPTPALLLTGYGIFHLMQLGSPSIGPAALQVVAPSHLRGKLASVYVLCTGIIGTALGPLLVASVTDFVFHDEQALGWSLAIVGGGCTLLGGVLLLLGYRAMVEAVDGRSEQS